MIGKNCDVETKDYQMEDKEREDLLHESSEEKKDLKPWYCVRCKHYKPTHLVKCDPCGMPRPTATIGEKITAMRNGEQPPKVGRFQWVCSECDKPQHGGDVCDCVDHKPSVNPILDAYYRGEKVRLKGWNLRAYIVMGEHVKMYNMDGLDDDPEVYLKDMHERPHDYELYQPPAITYTGAREVMQALLDGKRLVCGEKSFTLDELLSITIGYTIESGEWRGHDLANKHANKHDDDPKYYPPAIFTEVTND
jgi:hypothetical protein